MRLLSCSFSQHTLVRAVFLPRQFPTCGASELSQTGGTLQYKDGLARNDPQVRKSRTRLPISERAKSVRRCIREAFLERYLFLLLHVTDRDRFLWKKVISDTV